jgi:hypothetical protein
MLLSFRVYSKREACFRDILQRNIKKLYTFHGDWYYEEVNEHMEPYGMCKRRVNGVV